MDKYFTTFEVAKLCHVSPGSVIRWVRRGKLPAAMTAGGHRRVLWVDVIKLLESMRMPIPPDFPKSAGRGYPAKVLVVDDDKPVRELIRTVFRQSFPDVEVEEAQDGFTAGWKAFSYCPDMIILDIRLPGLDGFRVCEFIRTIPELKHTKIIAITGLPVAETQEKILQLGADDFLAKPFDLDELKQKIAMHLEDRVGRK